MNSIPDENKDFDTGYTCLVLLCNSLGMKFDKSKISKKLRISLHEGKLTEKCIIKIAKFFKITLESVDTEIDSLKRYSQVSIGVLKDGNFILICNIEDNNRVLIFDPIENKPHSIGFDSFGEVWSGRVLRVKSFKNKKVWISKGWKLGFRWFMPMIKRYRRFFVEVFVAAFFLQLFGLVCPLFTQVIIDKAIPNKGEVTLSILAILFLFSVIFQAMLNMAKTYLLSHTTNKMDVVLGSKLMRHLLSLPLRYFELRCSGSILMKVNALNSIREFFTGKTLLLIIDGFFSFVFLIFLFNYSLFLTLIALIPIPIYFFQNIKLMPIFRNKLERSWESASQSNAFLVESITGMQTIKSLAIEPQFADRWEKHLASNVSNSFSLSSFSLLTNNIISTVQKISCFLVLLFGGRMVMEGKFSLGQLIAFQMIAGQFISSLTQIISTWPEAQQTSMALERLGDVLETDGETHGTMRLEREEIRKGIEFKNVCFSYNPMSTDVIKGISFSLQPNTKIGIVGRSGSGKSTVAKLVQKMYIPRDGQILFGEVNILDIAPESLRMKIGVVMQDSYLFSGSIRENIALACPSADISEVINVAKLAGAHEFILELPNGYDTKVGERGSALSGGQKQRIAIARALIHNPSFLIFDEATSALDYESERLIIKNIDEICMGKSAIIIAHRLSAVRNCDKILVLEKGEIIESGKHDDLMSAQGEYYKLYTLQEIYT